MNQAGIRHIWAERLTSQGKTDKIGPVKTHKEWCKNA